MRITPISRFAIAATALAAGFLSTASGIVNHVPTIDGAEGAQQLHIERSAQGLNQAIANDFAEIPAFPYWERVGMVGMGSGIYLGDGNVLTSAHVGCYPFRLQDGSFYEPDYKSWRVLKNADGTKSDLAVFRVSYKSTSSLAKLTPISLGRAPQKDSNSPVLLIGTGFSQNEKPLTLSSIGNTMAVVGYRVDRNRNKAWGFSRTNQELNQPVATGTQFSTQCFTTRFEQSPFAGQATDGDSGGAAFAYNRTLGRWELVGCIIAVSQQQLSVTFGNRTFLGDLAAYSSQIPGMENLETPIANAKELSVEPAIKARAASIQ